MSLELVPVNVSFAPAHVRQRVNVVKYVFRHLIVSSLVKPMFLNLNTVRSLNTSNAVKPVSSAHHICRVFPVTHDIISNHRQAFFIRKQMPLFFLKFDFKS